MARVRIDNSVGTLGAALSSAGTTITFASAPSWATLAKGNVIALVLDPPGATSPNGSYEVVYVTAYTAGATTATIKRGQEGTTGVSHASGATWMLAETAADVWSPIPTAYTSDFTDAASLAADPSSSAPLVYTNGAPTIDTTNQQIKNTTGADIRVLLNTSNLGLGYWRDCAVQVKYVPSVANPAFALSVADNNAWALFSGGTLVLRNFVGGANNVGTSQAASFTAGSTYWVRFEMRGPSWMAEVWTKDPATRVAGDAPTIANSGFLTAALRMAYGRPGFVMDTNGDLIKEIKFWRYAEAVEG